MKKLPNLIIYLNENGNNEKLDYSLFDINADVKSNITENALIYVLRNNYSRNLYLSEKQLNYLIKHSDLDLVDETGANALLYAFECNNIEKLYLNEKQLDYLIAHSYKVCEDIFGQSALYLAISFNKTENLNLTANQIASLVEKMNFEKKENLRQLSKLVNLFEYEWDIFIDQFAVFFTSLKDKQFFVNFVEQQDTNLKNILNSKEIIAFKEKKIIDEKICVSLKANNVNKL